MSETWKLELNVPNFSEEQVNKLIDSIVDLIQKEGSVVIGSAILGDQAVQVNAGSYHHVVVKGPTGIGVFPVENEEIPDGKENTG